MFIVPNGTFFFARSRVVPPLRAKVVGWEAATINISRLAALHRGPMNKNRRGFLLKPKQKG